METIESVDLVDLTLRTLGLLLLITLVLYWYFTEKLADKAKPRDTKSIRRLFADMLWFVVFAQLIGINILSFSQNVFLQSIGIVLLTVGVTVCVFARRALGANWAHGAEFQIKKNQQLVTHGIYKYVRHPIYTGVFLIAIGSELIANSWLAVVLLVVLIPILRYQAKQEERLLVKHFGESYKQYIQRSHMFLPHVIYH